MRLFSRGVAAVLALLALLAFATPAFAAPAAWESIDVTLHDEKPSPILLVSATLPDSTKLPANVELAVPSGGQFQWAGEILGGEPDQDPSVKYKVATKGDMDIYSFTLTKARTAQIEVVVPAAVQFDGTQYTSALKYTATQAVPSLALSVRMPQGAKVAVTADGAESVPGPPGYSYYMKSLKKVAAGDVAELAFAYTLPAGAAAGEGAGAPGAGGSTNTIVLVLLMAAFGAAFLFAGRAISRKMKRSDVEYEADEGSESYAFEAEAETATVVAEQPKPKSQKSGKRAEPEPEPEAPKARKLDPRWLLAGVVVIALVVAGLVAGRSGTSAQLVDGTYQRNFGGTGTCTTAEIALAIPADANAGKAAEKVFTSIEGQPSVGLVTIYVDNPRAVVEFCESGNNEQAIRNAIAASGYLDPSAPAPSQPATPAAQEGQS